MRETGDGYPDITLLPMIANYFKVTIDELMGNDEIGQREDISVFWNTYHKIRDRVERVEYILSYTRKYPKEYKIAQELTRAITELPKEKWEEYLPILRENAEKIVSECTIQWIREYAIRDMCLVCPEEELDRWERMCAAQYDAYRGEVIEQRLKKQGRKEEAILRHGINNFYMLCHFLTRHNYEYQDSGLAIAWCRNQIKLMEFLGVGTAVPEVWIGRCAYCEMELASHLFYKGEIEEGCAWLDRSFEHYAQWCSIPAGTPLDVGCPEMFGEIKGVRGGTMDAHDWDIVLPDGTNEYFQEAYAYILPDKADLYHMLLHWGRTKNIREEEWVQPYIARAKALAGIE